MNILIYVCNQIPSFIYTSAMSETEYSEKNSSIPRIRPESIRILCVDEDASSLSELERIFKFRAFNTTLTQKGIEALEIRAKGEFDIVLANTQLQDMSGIELLEQFKEKSPDTLRILLTANNDISETTAAINQGNIYRIISKPWNEDDLMTFVTSAVEATVTRREDRHIQDQAKKENQKLANLVDSLETQVQENSVLLTAANRKVQSSYVNAIRTFLHFLEIKNFSLHKHSKRVGHFAMRTAQIAGLSEDEVQNILIAGLLHDVGKLGLSDRLLATKPISLNEMDLRAYQRHPTIGKDSLQILEELDDVLNMIHSHHEHMDGSGFPMGISGDNISQGSRILAIVEAYEEYKYGVLDYNDGHQHALDMLIRNRGMYYCPTMLSCFLKVFN
jgi:response regulator RpfG family c-di-GMP phosphodiesterase